MMPRQKRFFSDEEVTSLQRMMANHIDWGDIASAFGVSRNTLKRILSELEEAGKIPKTTQATTEKTIEKTTKTNTTEDMTIPATKRKYVSEAKNLLSDVLISDLQMSMQMARILRKAELLYRSNVEAMGFNWEEWIQGALESFYEDTTKWYELEGQNPSLEEVMEEATEIATAKEFLEGINGN